MDPVEIPCGYSQSMPKSHQDWWYHPGASHLQQLGLSRDITYDTMGLSPSSCCIFDAMDCHGPFGTLLSVLEQLQLFAKRVPGWHQFLALWSFLPQRQLENWRKSSTYCLKVWAWECLTANCLQNDGWLLGVGSWTFVSSACFFLLFCNWFSAELACFFLSGSVWLPVCNMLALESPMCPVLATFWCSYPRIPNLMFLSFLFLSPFLPLFLPLFLPSFIPSFLPFFLSPFHPFFLPFFLRCFLSSFIPSFLPCWLRSFCARNSLFLIPNIVRKFGFGEWDWSNFSFPHLRFIVSLCSFDLHENARGQGDLSKQNLCELCPELRRGHYCIWGNWAHMKIIPADQKHPKHMLGMIPYIIIYIPTG